MTHRRKRLVILLAVVLLAAGGAGWYWHHWQATAVDRRVRVWLNDFRREDPGWIHRWLIKLKLTEDRRSWESPDRKSVV